MWSRSKSSGSACCGTPSWTRPEKPARAPSGARRGGRRDQLDGVIAVPFGRTRDGRDFAALAIDKHRGRHAERPAYGFKILKNLGFLVAKIVEAGQPGLFQEVLRLFRI